VNLFGWRNIVVPDTIIRFLVRLGSRFSVPARPSAGHRAQSRSRIGRRPTAQRREASLTAHVVARRPQFERDLAAHQVHRLSGDGGQARRQVWIVEAGAFRHQLFRSCQLIALDVGITAARLLAGSGFIESLMHWIISPMRMTFFAVMVICLCRYSIDPFNRLSSCADTERNCSWSAEINVFFMLRVYILGASKNNDVRPNSVVYRSRTINCTRLAQVLDAGRCCSHWLEI
jgi:hypothetical protein